MKTYFGQGQSPLTRSQLALTTYLAINGDGQTQADAKAGKLKIESYTSTFRFKIPNAQGGKVVLLDPSYVFSEGSIPEEWSQAQLQPGVNMAIDYIRTGFVADASNTVPQAGTAFANLVNGWPAALRNGRYVFSQSNGNPVFVHVDKTGPQAAGFGNSTSSDGFEFDEPMIFAEKKQTRFELWIPAAQSFGSPAGANLLEISFLGSWIRPRA